jgi:hypothetical protein
MFWKGHIKTVDDSKMFTEISGMIARIELRMSSPKVV